ncbi:hypothetical protein [Arcobacter sp.]|uniref:hypothetical protein n=1 Tax=Arcobacter sp. TaxID=1872629 RepID=UPI003C7428F1
MLNVKKRMMYTTNSDYYFLTYNLLVILDYYGCTSSDKMFHDFRKISFLIDFSSNSRLHKLLQKKETNTLYGEDMDLLRSSYSKSLLRIKEVRKIIYALTKRNILHVSNTNIYLNKESIPKNFFDKKLFCNEYHNLKNTKNKRLRTMKYSSFLESLYANNGVSLWDI